MPEGKNNQFAAGHAVVNVIPGAGEIEPTDVRVVTRSVTSPDSRLLGEHFERLPPSPSESRLELQGDSPPTTARRTQSAQARAE